MFNTILLSLNLLFATLSGTVTDKNTGNPIANAQVIIEPINQTTITDSLGKFNIDQIPEGKYKLVIQSLGYDIYYQTIAIDQAIKSFDIKLSPIENSLEEVVVESIKAEKRNATSYTNINAKEIAPNNLGQDLPLLLNATPSVVTTTNSGMGIGYTGIRIRGTDANRINVTINGIPVNDAESHGTFWVNMPDLASSVGNIQVQRGIGTSSNGAAAFGGSVNIQTNNLSKQPFAQISSSLGSFNTFKNTVQAGTGLINNKFALETRLSKITSDGFIDRAFSDLKSFYLSGAYYGNKSILKGIILSGTEKTYQAWNGVPENILKAGNRTYNPFTYANQIDNYQQDYYQLHYTKEVNANFNVNAALFYTKGRGYYEEFQTRENFEIYGLKPIIFSDTTINSTDLIRQKWLDNHFYGFTFSTNYQKEKFKLSLGGGANQYIGDHFGKIIWAQYASNSFIADKYYDNDATKNDLNLYSKIYYQFSPVLNTFVDLQGRFIKYNFLGINQLLLPMQQTVDYFFFNPKVGLVWDISPSNYWYTSIGVAHKEPTRNDFVVATPDRRPSAERLINLESGLKGNRGIWEYAANVYWMQYQNQLVLTGKLNDVGDAIRQNVPTSYRAGVELLAGIKLDKKFKALLNLTLSRNRIQNYTQYLYSYDDEFQEKAIEYKNTDIAFSPNLIVGGQIVYIPIKNISLALLPKYISKQFLDNTSDNSRMLDAYKVFDTRIMYEPSTKLLKNLSFTLLINNILGEKYESDGATYPSLSAGQVINANYYFPQAGTHYYFGVNLKF